jgi:hypothetical protein
MERMYEGVYQFLEFFAVLSEEQGKVFIGLDGMERELRGALVWGDKEQNEAMGGVGMVGWKGILAKWEMCCELVTLLRELEGGIPKVGDSVPATTAVGGEVKRGAVQTIPASSSFSSAAPAPQPPPMQRSLSADAATSGSKSSNQPVSVERPFDVDPLPPSLAPGNQPPHQIFEPETPLAFPEDFTNISQNALAPANSITGHPAPLPTDLHPPPHHDQDEPSDFEWRNLKKLTVLVLSSLIWKTPLVQEQLRKYGGLEALVGCCRHDENNPYIREHAIMCLRFAVEGCEENADALVRLAGERGQSALRGASGGREGVKKALAEADGPESIPRDLLDADGFGMAVTDPKGTGLIQSGTRVTGSNSSPVPHIGGASKLLPRDWSTAKSPFNLDDFLPSLTAAARTNAEVSVTASIRTESVQAGKGKSAAEEGRDLIRHAILNFPLKEGEAIEEWQRAEALERLDKAFESTEAALEGQSETQPTVRKESEGGPQDGSKGKG